jgi:hypothetical protein
MTDLGEISIPRAMMDGRTWLGLRSVRDEGVVQGKHSIYRSRPRLLRI